MFTDQLVRSATWDPSVLTSRQREKQVIDLYRDLALAEVGLIVSGSYPIDRECFPEEDMDQRISLCDDLREDSLEEMPQDLILKARHGVGNFRILNKIICKDILEGGINHSSFPESAQEIVKVGVDAIEISGGMGEGLFRSEGEPGVRPVPAPEAHTRMCSPEQQSYFWSCAEQLDLPNRSSAGISKSRPECISCLYDMFVHPGKPVPGVVTCICKTDKKLHPQIQKWLVTVRISERLGNEIKLAKIPI